MNSEKVYYDYRESTATTQEQSSDTDGLDKEISIATFPSLVRKRSYSLDGATGLDLNTVITYGNPKGNASEMLSTTNLPSNVAIGVGESKNNHTNVSAPSFGSVLGNSGSDSNNQSGTGSDNDYDPGHRWKDPKSSEMMIFRPSNTIIASNGEIYQVEPYAMPPPSEIAALYRDRRDNNERDKQIQSLEQSPLITKKKSLGFGNRSDMFSLRDFSSYRPRSDTEVSQGSDISYLTTGGNSPLSSSKNTDYHQYASTHPRMAQITTKPTGPLPTDLFGSASSNSSADNSPTHAQLMLALENANTNSYVLNQNVGINKNNGTNAIPFSSSSNNNNNNNFVYREGLHRTGLTRRAANSSQHASYQSPTKQQIFDIRHNRDVSDVDTENEDAGNSGKVSKAGSGSESSNTQSLAIQHAKESEHYVDFKTFDFLKFVRREVLGVGQPSTGEKQGTENIQNFLRVPLLLETLIWLGFLLCMDSFIYVFTYLPLRCLQAVYLLGVDLTLSLYHQVFGKTTSRSTAGNESGSESISQKFVRANGYDLMRGFLLVTSVYVLQMLNMSRVYHYIRGQTMIKLYVLTAMLEILDRLLSSFGQDAFDSLSTRMRTFKRTKLTDIYMLAVSYVVVSLYLVIHSSIYFIHVATLTVAINSAEQAMVTVLILNNFAEIKGFVFKKFDKTNLFQLACSDITERFQLLLFLGVIVVVALVQAGDNWYEVLPSHYFVVWMLCGECLADWIKHAFISKFNHIDASVYAEFASVLRRDITRSFTQDKGNEHALDRIYAITRRVGLSQIPLAVVTIRYLNLAWYSPQFQYYFNQFSLESRIAILMGCFLSLFVFKMIFGTCIFLGAAYIQNNELIKKEERKQKGMVRKKSVSGLANVERYSTMKNIRYNG